MFNPELKGIYSPIVEDELIKLADYFEQKNKVIYISGIDNSRSTLIIPTCMVSDNITTEDWITVNDYVWNYTGSLTAEEFERVGTLPVLNMEQFRHADSNEEIKRLWVK